MTINHRSVANYTANLLDDGGKKLTQLLWGDPVREFPEADGDWVKVRARQRVGWLHRDDISDVSLLEIYVIDVGQGDGVLMKTPDKCWHLIDAGRPAEQQMTKKGAANFVRWKFIDDLQRDKVSLKTAVLSHPDLDHFGGFIDVLSGKLPGRAPFSVEVDRLFHSGLGRFAAAPGLGPKFPGEVDPFPQAGRGIRTSGSFHTELVDDAASFADPPRALAPTFGAFADLVATVPDEVKRLDTSHGFLPGYESGDVTIKILGPILETFGAGRQGLRSLGADSITLNGHSVVLRVDYEDVRILLTGDLNSRSQKLLRSYWGDAEFAVDVAKGCHHGAEDVDMDFIRAMAARATVISSGDDEDYAHPRPIIMGASGRYGRESVSPDGDPIPPLLYSTELARAVQLRYAYRLMDERSDETFLPSDVQVRVDPKKAEWRRMEWSPVASNLVYGLVNVRTDGKDVLLATLEEQGTDFDVNVISIGS